MLWQYLPYVLAIVLMLAGVAAGVTIWLASLPTTERRDLEDTDDYRKR